MPPKKPATAGYRDVFGNRDGHRGPLVLRDGTSVAWPQGWSQEDADRWRKANRLEKPYVESWRNSWLADRGREVGEHAERAIGRCNSVTLGTEPYDCALRGLQLDLSSIVMRANGGIGVAA